MNSSRGEARRELLGRGSTRDLYVFSDVPAKDSVGGSGTEPILEMEFSDRISVFDYGPLPDQVPGKGLASAIVAEKLFQALTVPHAFLRREGASLFLRRATHPKFEHPKFVRPTFAQPKFVQPKFAQAESTHARHASLSSEWKLQFVPLEIIFRWGAPRGSSILKRDPSLTAGARFDQPTVEFTTKLEATDRLLTTQEAEQVLKTHVGEQPRHEGPRLDGLRALAVQVAHDLKTFFQSLGLELWDGKIECGWDFELKHFVVLDPLSPDELRVSVPGKESIALSKELLRQWLGRSPWGFLATQTKAQNREGWKSLIPAPPRLGEWRQSTLSALYRAWADALVAGNAKALWGWIQQVSSPSAMQGLLKPKVCVVGQGGREEAERFRLRIEGCEVVSDLAAADAVWVSKDGDLADAMVDRLIRDRLWVFGPTQAGSEIEWSKKVGSDLAVKAGIPRPKTSQDPQSMRKDFQDPPVVKMVGLAAGKGVIVPDSWEQADSAVKELGSKSELILEERLRGYEASFFFSLLTTHQGVEVEYLGSAQDFKRRFEADEGPNTGGMGAIAPHPRVSPDDVTLMSGWAESIGQELVRAGRSYHGILYLGCLKDMIQGWKLLEFNARFGDPETQALLELFPDQFGDRWVLRQLMGLDIRLPYLSAFSREIQPLPTAVCLALVHPEYPQSGPAIELSAWNPSSEVRLYRTGSQTGRLAYLVAKAESHAVAGDRIFGALIHSPWKDVVEWRKDLLS